MKLVVYSDKDGYVRRSIVPDDSDESAAEFGVPSGPPDLDQLDWSAIRREISNSLAKHGLWTWDEVQADPNGVGVALTIFKRYLIALYRDEWNKPKPAR